MYIVHGLGILDDKIYEISPFILLVHAFSSLWLLLNSKPATKSGKVPSTLFSTDNQEPVCHGQLSLQLMGITTSRHVEWGHGLSGSASDAWLQTLHQCSWSALENLFWRFVLSWRINVLSTRYYCLKNISFNNQIIRKKGYQLLYKLISIYYI